MPQTLQKLEFGSIGLVHKVHDGFVELDDACTVDGAVLALGVLSPGSNILAAEPETSSAAMCATLNILDCIVKLNISILVNLRTTSRIMLYGCLQFFVG